MAAETKTETPAAATNDEMPTLEEQPAAKTTAEEGMPSLEEQPAAGGLPAGLEGLAGKKAQTRTEKKSRKALQKMGLKPFTGVVRVQLRQRGHNVVISDAEVFKGNGDLYVVFGTPQSEDQQFSKQKQVQALKEVLEKAKAGDVGALQNQLKELGIEKPVEEPAPAAKVEEEPEGEVDASGLTEKDIELVRTQGNVSRAVAIKTLKKNNGDIVQSIMDLTGVKG